MKYEAVIETDDYEDFEFFEDGNGKYIHGIDAGAVNNEWIALYFKECKQESIIDKIRADIQGLRNCSCSNSDGIIDDVEDILDRYKADPEIEEGREKG